MVQDFKSSSSDMMWNYRWVLGQSPVAHFEHQKMRMNVIYTAEELCAILERSDEENSFIPVPRRVMQGAFDLVNSVSVRAA